MKHSWLVTGEGAWALNRKSADRIYPKLLNPEVNKPFVLSLLHQGADDNLAHLSVVNFPENLNNKTVLKFTVNNKPFQWSPYELEEGLRNGTTGKEPGVKLLIEIFGPHELPPLPEPPAYQKDESGKSVGGTIKGTVKGHYKK
jgi:hypothetical protein